MKKYITLLFTASIFSTSIFAQVTPVDPATFAGHYFTDTKMNIDGKKSTELDMTFDLTNGRFSGVSPAKPNNSDLVKFLADATFRKWASESKVWMWENPASNDMDYGSDMFNRSMNFGTFIEDGVFVIFKANGAKDKKVKTFEAVNDMQYVHIMAKDKAKLSMDKTVAMQKAEDMINVAAGNNIKKELDGYAKAAVAVPNETLSKTDKKLKAEITALLNSFRDMNDPTDMLCAYTTSNDWTIKTNSLTGAILAREIDADMILKNRNSGNCWRVPYTLVAQYNGTGYGKLAFKQKWDMNKCDCAQVDKNK